MSRQALTKADWTAFSRAANREPGDAVGAEFRAEVEKIIRRRLIKAWDEGYNRGWADGVDDATQDDGATPSRNPYRA